MEELERIRKAWDNIVRGDGRTLSCTSGEFITKFNARLKFTDVKSGSSSLVHTLSHVQQVTQIEIEQLRSRLELEEKFLKFITTEMSMAESRTASSGISDEESAMNTDVYDNYNCIDTNVQAPDRLEVKSEDTGQIYTYAQVNKQARKEVNKSESASMNSGNVNSAVDMKTEIQISVDQSAYEEVIYRPDVSTAPVEGATSKPGREIRKLRGSVKDAIKQFERSESTSSEETLDNHSKTAVPPKEPPKPSPKPVRADRRRRPQENTYEDIEIPSSTSTPTFSFKNKPPRAPPITGKGEDKPNVDNSVTSNKSYESIEHSSVDSTVISRGKHGIKVKPAVPQRRSKIHDVHDAGSNPDILRQTEEQTLKQSQEEPSLSASFRGPEVKVTGRHQFHPIERDSKINVDDVEGDYCSISELHKHITVLNVNPQVQVAVSTLSSPESDDADYVTILEKLPEPEKTKTEEKHTDKPTDKHTEQRTESEPEAHEVTEKANTEKLEKENTENGEADDEKMKKLFNRKSGGIHSDICVEPFSPVVGKRYKSLSTSSESEEDNCTKTAVPWSTEGDTENVNNTTLRSKRKTRVPDYESLSFQSLLTTMGVSAADPDNLHDTCSEDDATADETDPDRLDSVDSIKEGSESVSHNSDDSGVCDTVSTDLQASQGSSDNKKSAALLRSDSTSINLEDDHRKVSVTTSVISRISSASTDSVDSPDFHSPLYEEAERSGEDDDNLSTGSHDDRLVKPEGVDEESLLEKRAAQLHMRHLVVKGILESEKTYLHVIDELVKAKRFLQSAAMQKEPCIAPEDVTIIFYLLDEIYQKHKQFVEELEGKVNNWNDKQEIGNCFKLMVFYFKLYEQYIDNYPKAVEKIHKNLEEESSRHLLEEMMEPFKDETSKLEDILLKPVHRIQRNTLVLHDLIKHTPADHTDYPTLEKALKLSEENLKTYNKQTGKILSESTSERRKLIKCGFVVEVAKDKKATRHLRYLFLFDEVLICTKHKARHREGSFKYIWSFFLSSTSVDFKVDKKYMCKESVDELKSKIGQLKEDLRDESKKEESLREKAFSIGHKSAVRKIEKLKKKIQEQEACLVEALPHLPLSIDRDGQRSHVLLFTTDYERDEWRDAIQTQIERQIDMQPPSLTVHAMEAFINETKQRPQVNSIGTALLKKDEEMLNGSLNVTIHKLHGLEKVCDTYCCLEMDFYGFFYKKAQTRTCENTTDPAWNQDFELELDCSQTLRILCYEKKGEGDDVIIGKCALELSLMWLNSKFNEKTIMMNDVSITISIRHTPASKTLKRTQSRLKSGIFGVKIQNTTKRECKTVPSVVSMCVQEVEKRGLEELGIYRVSGVTSEVQYLKKLFDKNPVGAANQVGEADIHAITGVLKLYFRELPEPLFTDSYYQSFIQAIELSDEEAKEKCLIELLHSLPEANYYTIVYIIEHLVRVSKHSNINKMSINNVSTIFGPTLLNPAEKESSDDPMLQIARAARDASVQCEVINYFVSYAASGKNIRKSAQVISSQM